jgi:probable phosphoglycerate mutase
MVSHIYLLRHGQTEWTISGRHTGITDIELTEHGEEEALTLGERLHGLVFNHVFTSPRRRARHTCDLAGLGYNATIEEDLREWTYGGYEGLKSSEIIAQRPGWNIFAHGCPDGESPQQISDRADRVLDKIAALEGSVAVFSHGHFTRVLAARWVKMPVANAQILASSTASIGVLGTSPNGPRPIIELWNSVLTLP